MSSEKIHQLYKVIGLVFDFIEEHHKVSGETFDNLEHNVSTLNEMFKPVEITVEMVKQLRSQTGEGMMSCKKALEQAKGDMQLAVDIMRSSGNICI